MLERVTAVDLAAALQNAHDWLDDWNAADGDATHLCLLCNASRYDSIEGIIHANDCPLPQYRALLARWRAQQDTQPAAP